MSEDIFDGLTKDEDVLKSTSLTREEAFKLARDVAHERLGVGGASASLAEERKSAMTFIYGDPTNAYQRDEAGNIALKKKPSAMSDNERVSLMQTIRQNVQSKFEAGE